MYVCIYVCRGTFEWKGDWSDDSLLWSTHPGVAFEIGRPARSDDGTFYISWEDFIQHFNLVDVLFPVVGVDNLHLKVLYCSMYVRYVIYYYTYLIH